MFAYSQLPVALTFNFWNGKVASVSGAGQTLCVWHAGFVALWKAPQPLNSLAPKHLSYLIWTPIPKSIR